MQDVDNFSIHDAYFGVGVKSGNYDMFKPLKDGDWENYRVVRAVLKENGYVFHDDPRLHYKSLRRSHHAGSKGDIHFHSQIYPTGFRFEFYRDVPTDNPNGGRYGFNKMETAPYLWRKRVELIHWKMAVALLGRGFEDHTPLVFETAYEEVFERRRKTADWHFKSVFGPEPPESYNCKDADGVPMKGGELRYWYTHNGRLQRGVVHREINNVWPIVVNRHQAAYGVANHNLFTYDPDKHPRKISLNPLVNITRALDRAIQKRDFKKAARIQEALDRMTKLADLKPGDQVMVDNPRYHGLGIVDWVKPPLWVGVKVGEKGDGNLWRYEWATVKPAAAEVIA